MCTLSGRPGCPFREMEAAPRGKSTWTAAGPRSLFEGRSSLVDRPGQEELAPSQPEADRPVPVAPWVHLLPSGHRSVVGKAPEHRVRACRT